MATPSAALLERLDRQGIPKSKRKLQKHLRSAGLAYISRTGKLIPAKKVAEELCQCPQKCDERVPMEARQCLFTHFYGLGEADLQNQFLRQNMDLRARLNVPEATGTGRTPRRITCKYLVPLLPSDDKVEVCQKAFVSAFVITTKRVRLQREKLISSLGLNSYSSHNRSKASTNNNVNNNNNINVNNMNTSMENHQMKIAAAVAAATAAAASRKAAKSNLMPLLSLNVPDDEEEEPYDVESEPKSPQMPALTAEETNNNNNNKNSSHSNNKNINNNNNNSNNIINSVVSKLNRNSVTISRSNRGNSTGNRRRRAVDNPLIPMGLLVPDGVTIAPVTATPDHDRDIAIVHNFFSNQLWKPEYIGAYS